MLPCTLAAMLVLALLAAAAPPPSTAEPPEALSAFVVYVATTGSGRCVYMTGDVQLGARDFKDDLKERFDPTRPLLIYHDAKVLRSCLATARSIARQVGFTSVRAEPAPPDLDMGPPR